jgi:hypothetical protein
MYLVICYPFGIFKLLFFQYKQQDKKRLIRNRNCLHFERIWVHPQFLVGSMLLMLSVFCVVFFVLFVFVLCLMYPMLPVSLDCPFLIAPSVFSSLYLMGLIHTYSIKREVCVLRLGIEFFLKNTTLSEQFQNLMGKW